MFGRELHYFSCGGWPRWRSLCIRIRECTVRRARGARDERAARAHIRSERRTHARCGLHVRIRHFFASDLLLHASSACGRADGSARERACACGRRACVPHRRVLADEGLAEPLRRLEVHHAQVLRGKRHGCRYCGEVNRTRGCSELRRSRGFKVRNRCAQLCNDRLAFSVRP